MISEEKRFLAQVQNLEALSKHMIEDLGFTHEELNTCVGWLQNDYGLPIIATPYQAFCMLATVARAIKFDIVEKKKKIEVIKG